MKKYFKFIAIGILAMAAGEFHINAIIFGSILKFLMAVALYALLITFFYWIGKLFDKSFSPRRVDIYYYFFSGILSVLVIEWWILANAPWENRGAIDAGMFAWWAGVFTLPRIFTTPHGISGLNKKLLWTLVIYSLVSIALVLAVPVNIKPAISGLTFSAAFILLGFQYLPFFGRNGALTYGMKIFMWLLVLGGVSDVLLNW